MVDRKYYAGRHMVVVPPGPRHHRRPYAIVQLQHDGLLELERVIRYDARTDRFLSSLYGATLSRGPGQEVRPYREVRVKMQDGFWGILSTLSHPDCPPATACKAYLGNGQVMERAAQMCERALYALKTDRAGRHGDVDNYAIFGPMCSDECRDSDGLHLEAMAKSSCTCRDLGPRRRATATAAYWKKSRTGASARRGPGTGRASWATSGSARTAPRVRSASATRAGSCAASWTGGRRLGLPARRLHVSAPRSTASSGRASEARRLRRSGVFDRACRRAAGALAGALLALYPG